MSEKSLLVEEVRSSNKSQRVVHFEELAPFFNLIALADDLVRIRQQFRASRQIAVPHIASITFLLRPLSAMKYRYGNAH